MSTLVVQPPAQSTYGAVELKIFIGKNTLRAFIITSIALLLLLLLYWGANEIFKEKPKKFHFPPISTVSLIPPAPPDESSDELEEPPVAPEEILVGIASRAGIPVPVPAAELDKDLAEFADLDEMENATDVAADIIGDMDDIKLDDQPKVTAKVEDVKTEELPPRDKFIPVEVKAQTDMKALAQMLEYPEMAKRAGIEGQVHIQLWIDKDGKPQKPIVIKSPSEMLNKAAIEAVMKAVWTPAIQNDRTVGMWVTIPITFKLTR